MLTTTPPGCDQGDERDQLLGSDPREVEQHVDRLGHGVGDGGGGVVDDLVGARGPDALGAARAGGGDHVRAGPLGQLHGVAADRAARAVDQHALPGARARRRRRAPARR